MYPMNKLISAAFGMFTVLATCVSSNLSAATPDWENPEVFAEGREPVRATAFPYPSKAEALRVLKLFISCRSSLVEVLG